MSKIWKFQFRNLLLLSCLVHFSQGWVPYRFGWICNKQLGKPGNCRSSTSLSAAGPLRRPIRRSSQEASVQMEKEEVAKRHEQALQDPTLLSNIPFTELAVHSDTRRALTEVLGLQQMTEIQAQTYSYAVNGTSLVARARTGVGKTLAFLVPAVERLIEESSLSPGRQIGILVVAPTRELVVQIAQQAEALLTFHAQSNPSNWKVQAMYGGTKMQRDLSALNKDIPAILVATPGRILDHTIGKKSGSSESDSSFDPKKHNSGSRVRGRLFKDLLSETNIVILDEADRLLEGHFRKETMQILSYLPRADKRQTMLFSATFPKRLQQDLKSKQSKNLLPSTYESIDCVSDKDVRTQTSQRVEQSFCQLPDMNVYVPLLVSLILEETKENKESKLLVFFPTAKLAKFWAELFLHMDSPVELPPIFEIHSRMSQAARSRASESFRKARSAILFSSDVSARGVDYPDVSLVIQYGAPYRDELYLHRLGRTARAGKQGRGLVFLMPFENSFRRKLRKRNVKENSSIIENKINSNVVEKIEGIRQLVRSGHAALTPTANSACKSFCAHYVKYADKDMTSEALRKATADLAENFGLSEIPELPHDLLSKM